MERLYGASNNGMIYPAAGIMPSSVLSSADKHIQASAIGSSK